MNLSIVVPAFNEMENLPEMFALLEGFVLMSPFGVQVVVVDDGSSDGTSQWLAAQHEIRPWLTVIFNRTNAGMGAALKKGSAQAQNPLIAWVMADHSDHLEDLWEMRRRLLDGADLVIASRAMGGGSYGNFRGIKALGSWGYSRFTKWFLGLPVSDCTNAFRAFRKTMFDDLPLLHDGFAISPEMVIKAVESGFQVEQTPTTYTFRKRGNSNFKIIRMGLTYFRLTFSAFLRRLSGATD